MRYIGLIRRVIRLNKNTDKFVNPTMAESFGERLDKEIGDKYLNPEVYLQDSEYKAESAEKDPNISYDKDGNPMPEEFGYKVKGLEPTRYGDWERKGRCFDF